MSDRGVHPDLLIEEQAPEVPPAEAPRPRRGGRRAEPSPQQATPSPEEPTPTTEPAEAEEPSGAQAEHAAPEPPEWLAAAREATSPEEMLGLLTKNLPSDVLQRDDKLAGLLGSLSERRARALLAQQQQQAVDRDRQEAFQRGDLYALGQYAQADMQTRYDQQLQAAQLDAGPFMTGVRQFQAKLPPDVQQKIQGKTYAPDGTPADGVAAYMDATVEALVEHRLQAEMKKREPALKKALLSETLGSAPAPVLEGGRAPTIREITDVQLAAMSPAEADQVLDERGQVRPGYNLRLTRGIDLRQR